MQNLYDHRIFLFTKKLIVCAILICGMSINAEPGVSRIRLYAASDVEENTKTLWEIYREVKEMGRYPGEDFILRQFHVGDEDDSNQNIQVFILIQEIGEAEKMTIQVTYLKTSDHPPIGIPLEIKNIFCSIHASKLEITKSDYTAKETGAFLKELKRAVIDKKRLLGLIKKDRSIN